jgi:CYTH domain-containing protein
MERRRPGHGRYAHPEREQRWLLGEVPEGATQWSEITDRYLDGTNLRIRRVEGADGIVHKLTQKVRPVPDDPSRVMLTTMYVPDHEVTALLALPGRELRKTRHRIDLDGRHVAVDVFHDRFGGLILAETELGIREERMPMLPFACCDVTDDDRFAGGSLAATTDQALAELLAEIDELVATRSRAAGRSPSR